MTSILFKKFENRKFITSSIVIFLISILYSLLHGSGFYGYGIDYHSGYSYGFEWLKPSAESNFLDYVGFRVATLEINEFHLGVYVVTFVITLATGLFIRELLKFKQNYSLVFFLLVFLIAIHTWPVIMSTSNAMRQGLTMSFLFLVFAYSFRKNLNYILLFSFLAIVMHNSGIFFVTIFIFANILNKLLKNYSNKNKAIINFSIGMLSLVAIYYAVNIILLSDNHQASRIISGDFRWAFIIIAISYVILSFYFSNILTNPFNLSLYYFSFISLPVVMNGLNWQYERLGMMMLIPYIFSFGSLLNSRSYKFYLVTSFSLLLLLTIYTDKYSVGLLSEFEIYLRSL